ncbi:MAG TPA: aminodeoxychorismate lyase [Steroidobacteraceae bacterium]|nr:aminodeoxychorismate lyase [Steroidobacteraceae bacterium]
MTGRAPAASSAGAEGGAGAEGRAADGTTGGESRRPPATPITLVDGRAEAQLSVLDRGLQFGDGLFETIACVGGVPRFLDLHCERLALGCSRLRIDFPDMQALRAEVLALARDTPRCLIKVIVTRGTATQRGYAAAGNERARRITMRQAWPDEDPACAERGVRVCTREFRLGENPALAGLKHCNRLEQILARADWPGPDLAEGLLYSHSGRLVSGTMSNVFLVNGSSLMTPRLDLCGVAGVMRKVVLAEAQAARVNVGESELRAADVRSAQEIFLTNARIGIWPVRELDGRVLEPGPVTRRLQAALAPLLDGTRHG